MSGGDDLASRAARTARSISEGRDSPSLSVDTDVVVDIIRDEEIAAERLSDLVSFVLDQTAASGFWSVAIVLTDDARLRDLHRQFMGIDEETDVMTFPADPGPDGHDRGGDIVISVDRAGAQAGEFGHSTAHEVEFLAVHGLLHLLGWDDRTEERRAEMLTYQERLLAGFDLPAQPSSAGVK